MAPRYMNTKIESKNTILFTTLTEIFGNIDPFIHSFITHINFINFYSKQD